MLYVCRSLLKMTKVESVSPLVLKTKTHSWKYFAPYYYAKVKLLLPLKLVLFFCVFRLILALMSNSVVIRSSSL